jgi:hypothetical protein
MKQPGMRILLPVLCLAVLAGCTYSPFFIMQESALKRALPPDISMSDYVENDWFGNQVNVAEKLARLGAYTEGDKIRDGTGQEIRFVKQEDRSLKASPELLKQEQDRLRDLKKYFTVIEVQREPGPLPPAIVPSATAQTAKQAELPRATAAPPATTTPAGQLAPPASASRTAGDSWQPAK